MQKENTPKPSPSERETLRKKKAKEFRRAAYLKAKNSPATLERKAKMKEVRKAAYQKFKTSQKEKKLTQKKAIENERAAARAARDQALLEALKPATQLDATPPKLRVIAGGRGAATAET